MTMDIASFDYCMTSRDTTAAGTTNRGCAEGGRPLERSTNPLANFCTFRAIPIYGSRNLGTGIMESDVARVLLPLPDEMLTEIDAIRRDEPW